MPNRLRPTRLASTLASALFSLPLCAAGLGGLNDDYTPPPAPVKPKPQVVEKVVEKIVEKPIKDPTAEKRAQTAETDSRNKDAEIARLKAELAKVSKQPPKVVERVVEKVAEKSVPVQAAPPQPPAPVPASDPAAACWKNGAWEAACGFAAYAGGPVFRVVGGNLSFTMGSLETEKNRVNDEGPQHPVSFQRRFALAETEVTVAHYLACVQDGGCSEPRWRRAGSEYHYQTGSDPYYRDHKAHQPDSPIIGLSWSDSKAYVAWLSRKTGQTYTLPTEAQWEYAARGGQRGRWYFGDDESRLKDHAWYDINSGGKLHRVGSTRFNTHPWGLKDMAGNASEWVEDCDHGYIYALVSGDEPWNIPDFIRCDNRVFRGGSWYVDAGKVRAAARFRNSSDDRGVVSFRPARTL